MTCLASALGAGQARVCQADNYVDGMEAYRKAWAAYETQHYAEARQWADRAIRADAANPHAYALRGDLDYLAHDLRGAKTSWERALALEPRLRPLAQRLAQLAQEQVLEAGQVAHAEDLFVIRTPAEASLQIDASSVLRELRAAQTFLETQLQYRLQGPISVLVYPPSAFYGGLHVPTAVAGLFDGTVRLPAQTGPGMPSTKAVLWHELTHAAVHQMAKSHAPRWVHEGVAQVAQAQVEALGHEALAIAASRNELPSIAQLEGRADVIGDAVPMQAGLFYQASWAHAQYLVDHAGWTGLRRFLLALGEGASTTDALARVTNQREDRWDREWRRWVKALMDAP